MEGTAEIDALVKSANEMMMTTKQGENNLDSMLSRAHSVAARISSMYKYEKFLLDVQSLTVNGSRRKSILNDLQRENKQIMALQDENRQLREATDEYLAAIQEMLETHADIETSITMQESANEVDNIDNIIFEMANTTLENSLKQKALKMQEMMDSLDRSRREESNDLVLAVQSNKNYKELFKLACFSSPAAVNVLKSAMSAIISEMVEEETKENNQNHEQVLEEVKQEEDSTEEKQKEEEAEEEEENDDLNMTIVRQK